jgi:hypothetical protein
MALLEVNWNPTPRQLRSFAGIWLPLFLAAVGAGIGYRSGVWATAALLWIAALVIAFLGLMRPTLARPIYVVWMAAVYPIGWTISHALLAVLYFLVLTPIGLCMHACGYDPMRRRFDKSCPSYWEPHTPPDKMDSYFQQF